MSLADLESLYSQAVAALEAGDYDLAINKALACKMRLATTPNLSRILAGGGQQMMQWANAASLDQFIAQCRQMKATAIAASSRGPIQRTRIIYSRPDCE